MKVAWNLKCGGITGFTMAEDDELPVLHDVYSLAIQSGPKDQLHCSVSLEGPNFRL